MPVVHVMTGLPASGKTTAARKLQAESDGRMRRVNLDDLRAMLDIPAPEPRGYAHEQTVLAIQDAAVRAAVDDGFDVVVDNTHMTPHIPKRLKAAVAGQATFVVHDFTDVEELRQRKRDDLTGAVVDHEAAAAGGHHVPHPLVLACPRVRVDGQRQFRVRLARDVSRFDRCRQFLLRQQLMKSQVGLAHVFLPLPALIVTCGEGR